LRIWYKQQLTVLAQPADIEVFICGVMYRNDPTKPLIEIQLVAGDQHKTLFTHNPAVRTSEDPDNDDIIAKYTTKLAKFRDKACRTEYAKLFAPTPPPFA
jgi:hypothetical protein